MNERFRCQLTTKDANILEVMLERHGNQDGPFGQLLRLKLAIASVCLHGAIDPQAATVNSRIEYSVNGAPAIEGILVYGGDNAYPGKTLSITTMRGLALLGLVAPASIMCDGPDGEAETLQLLRVAYQPEASRRSQASCGMPGGSAPVDAPRSSVVVLGSRRKARPNPFAGFTDGDDPGPEAA